MAVLKYAIAKGECFFNVLKSRVYFLTDFDDFHQYNMGLLDFFGVGQLVGPSLVKTSFKTGVFINDLASHSHVKQVTESLAIIVTLVV